MADREATIERLQELLLRRSAANRQVEAVARQAVPAITRQRQLAAEIRELFRLATGRDMGALEDTLAASRLAQFTGSLGLWPFFGAVRGDTSQCTDYAKAEGAIQARYWLRRD
jgi:hypothetical protein